MFMICSFHAKGESAGAAPVRRWIMTRARHAGGAAIWPSDKMPASDKMIVFEGCGPTVRISNEQAIRER
jgi:hypothetical protein